MADKPSNPYQHLIDQANGKKDQPKLPPLRPKQEKFVQKYVENGGNASEAAREAGYSPQTAPAIGTENLQKPAIQAVLQVVRQSAAEQAGLRHVDVLKLAMNFATVDPIQLQDQDGNPLPLQQVPPEVRRCIQGVDIVPVQVKVEGRDDEDQPRFVTRYAYRYKLTSKDGALDKLMKHLGLYEKDNLQQASGIRELMQAIHGAATRIPLKP